MGRGNICTKGDFEGLYFVDREYLDMYSHKQDTNNILYLHDIYHSNVSLSDFDYDEFSSQSNFEYFIETFKTDFMSRFKSFTNNENNYFGTILESELFEVVIRDNEWSYAVCLIQKEETYYDNYNKANLQKKHYQTYLNGIKECLFNQFEEIGKYNGPWTHSTIKREVA